MGYRNHNTMIRIRLVNEIVQRHYVPGVTTYKGIFLKYVIPVYPMCYSTFLSYINTPVPRENEKSQQK